MNDQELLRLAHAYRLDELDDVDAATLADAIRGDTTKAGRALSFDGQLAVALSADADAALLARLRECWPENSTATVINVRSRRTAAIRRHRTGNAGWIAAAVLLLAVGGGLVWNRTPLVATSHLLATQLETRGETARLTHTGDTTSLTKARGLAAGDRLVVPVGTTVAITCPQEASVIHLSGPAELTITADAPGKHLTLRRGRLAATMAPQPSGHPLVVTCPFSAVTVIGTTFTIAVDTGGDRVEVQHGTVRVTPPGGGSGLAVTAGQVVEARAGSLARVDPPPMSSPSAPTPAGPTLPSAPSAPVAWFDFAAVSGLTVPNRADPRHPGALVDLGLAGGRDGQALKLRGDNGHFVFPTGTSRTMSVALWVRREARPAAPFGAALVLLPHFELYGSGSDHDRRDTNALHLVTRDRHPILGWSTSDGVVRVDGWQHVALIVADGPDGVPRPALYLDGVLQQLWPWSDDWEQPPGAPDTGSIGIAAGAQTSVAGLVDDVRVWTRALSAAEVAALAHGH